MAVLLLDDERSFKNGRRSFVARTVDMAIELTDPLDELDELWLDYVLAGWASTDEFLYHLLKRKREGNPLVLKTVYIHTSSFSAVELLQKLLSDLEVPAKDIIVVNYKDYMND
jgi:hypothetical protein